MQGGSIIKHTLCTGIDQLYFVESIQLGGVGELGFVELRYLGEVYDNRPLVVPHNLLTELHAHGAIQIYNEIPQSSLPTKRRNNY